MNPVNILMALDTVSTLMARAAAWNTAVRAANQEGRDLTDAEITTLREADNAADAKLEQAIQAKAARESITG